MKKETKDKIQSIVHDMVYGKIEGVIQSMTEDNTFEKELIDNPEVPYLSVNENKEFWNSGNYGHIDEVHILNLTDEITRSFMKRFKDE